MTTPGLHSAMWLTLLTLFGFLLDRDATDATVQALVEVVAKTLSTAGRSELHGEMQRKYLQSVKRLLTFSQSALPPTGPSKMVL